MTETTVRATTADQILDSLAAGLPNGRIPSTVYGNHELYELERRRIFARAWVFLAHESEIPARGDYVLRTIGEDSFIVARSEEGRINVLLNACRHRGVHICRADSGNSSHFRCPYHGWAYDNEGTLVGAPLWKNAFGSMDKGENALARPAKVDTYRGLIFATRDESAPSLDEYLGGMKWYLDLVFGLNEHGMQVLGAPQRFVINANWKSAAENFAGDDYHLGTLHKSVYAIGAFPVPFAENMNGYHIQAAPGHSLSLSIAADENEPGPRFFGYPERIVNTFNTSLISDEQLKIASRCRVMVSNVFPNFSVLAAVMTEDGANYAPTGVVTMRTWQPLGEGKLELWNWFLGYKNMDDAEKERAYKAGLGTFSMGGVFEMDDSEPWLTIAQTGSSVAAEVLDVQLNYQMGMPGVGISERADDWPGPGIAYSPRYDEGVQRNLFEMYLGLMTAAPGEWPTTPFDERV